MKLLILLVLLISLVGCSVEKWVRPNTSLTQQLDDEKGCRKYANEKCGYGPNRLIIFGPKASNTYHYYFHECMEQKGYKFVGTEDFPL